MAAIISRIAQQRLLEGPLGQRYVALRSHGRVAGKKWLIGQQTVGIARVLGSSAAIIIADEPTGNLISSGPTASFFSSSAGASSWVWLCTSILLD